MSIQRDLLARKLRAPQEKFVHDLAQLQATQAADTNVITSNLKGYAVKVASKTKSKDKFYAHAKQLQGANYYTGKYPDYDNLKLFIRTENFGQVYDYSLQGNDAYVMSDVKVQDVLIRDEPNNMVGSELVSYFNGSHYINVADNSRLRIKDIIVNEPTKVGFTIVKRFNPLRYGNSKQDSVILAQKVDTSQNQYGYSINMDDKGNIYFYVKYNYRQYFVKLDNVVTVNLGNIDFFSQNFKSENFKTELSEMDVWAERLYDLSCSFNFSTKVCTIKLRYKDETGTEIVQSKTSTAMLPPNVQLNLPLQEGKWSAVTQVPLNQVYDASSNNLVGTIQSPLNVEWNENNSINHTSTATAGYNITIPNNAAFNTFTEMTMAFWYKPLGNITLTNRIMMLGYDNTPHVKVHRNTDNSLSFTISLSVDGSVFTSSGKSNVFSTLNQWIFVVLKWKTGENLKISINDTADTATSSVVTGTFTQLTLPYTIYDWRPDNAILANVLFFKRKITAAEQTTLYNFGAHMAQFPESLQSQILQTGSPAPITVPFSILYDLPRIAVPTVADYTFLNNPSASNPFVAKYTCVAGTASTTAKVTHYNVPDGVIVTGSPFVMESELVSSDNSSGNLSSSNSKLAGPQIVSLSGRGLALNNKAITKAGFWLRKSGTVGGTLYCRIWNTATGAVIGNVGSMTNLDATLTTSFVYYEFTNLANTAKLNGVGYMIGLEYAWASSGQTITMQRVGSDSDATITQGYSDDGSNFNTNDAFEIAYRVFTGQGSTSSDPFYSMFFNNYKRVAQYVGTADPLIGKAVTEMTVKLYRANVASTGTLVWKIWRANGTTIITLNATALNVTDITTATTGAVYTFQDLTNTNQLAVGDRIGLEWVSQPNTTAKVFIMTNYGNNTTTDAAKNHKGITSYFSLYQISWVNTTSYDFSGTISSGGFSFTGYHRFSTLVTRIYERCVDISSSFYNQKITQAIAKIKRTGAIPDPSTILCNIRRSSDNGVVQTLGSFDANSISSTVFEDVIFTNIGATYFVQVGDYISFELVSCNATNYVDFAINNDVVDTTHSIMGNYANSVTSDLAQYDLSGSFLTGGEIDAVSRTRVGQFINTQDSLFMTTTNNKITHIDLAMYKSGAPTGTVYINIRDENDVAVKSLGNIAASGLSTNPAAPTVVPIEDLNNTYILAAKNIITVEFEGGNQTDKVGVQVKTGTYDGTNSHIGLYNGVVYDYNNGKDLVATMKVGGNTYTPDPADIPPVMPQLDTDLYIGVSGDKEGLITKEIMDLFIFTTEILTDSDLDNLYFTRNDIESNSYNEILMTNYSFVTLD